jgi:hypothetical protein
MQQPYPPPDSQDPAAMAVTYHRFPELGVNMLLLQGEVDGDQISATISTLDPEDPRNTRPMLNYIDPHADMTGVDLASIAELKKLVGDKVRAMFRDRPFTSAIVCDSRANEPLLQLWTSYVGLDREHPSNPRLVSSLKAACEYLDLPKTAHARLSEAIRAAARNGETRPRSA